MNHGSGSSSWGLTILRLVVGGVFLAHGGHKLFFWGFSGVANFLSSVGIPLPSVAAVVLTSVELLGGAGLVFGLLTRWAGLLLAADMVVAILVVKMKGGFFAPNGLEFELTLLAASLALMLAGPGAVSVDGAIAKRE
jgi:putative oxidoreductase